MSTPYRIEYKDIVSIAGHSDGYPKDVIFGEILIDLPTIKTNPDKYVAEIALEGEDYYGRQIDSYGNNPYEYLYIVDVENNTITVKYSNQPGVDVTINLDTFSPDVMGVDDYEVFLDDVQYGFECADIDNISVAESYGHKINIAEMA